MNALFNAEAKRSLHRLKMLVDTMAMWENLQNLAIQIHRPQRYGNGRS